MPQSKCRHFHSPSCRALYPSLEAVRHLRNTKVADQLQAIAEANDVHILPWWWVPGGFVTTSREITGPESVKGLKLRGGDPLFDLMLKKAGAIPVELTSNEIYAALKDGRLDGALTSYETFVSTNIQEHARHFTAGSPGIWMFATPLLISKSVWDSLSNSEKDAFEAAARSIRNLFHEHAGRSRSEVHQGFHGSGCQVSQIHARRIPRLAAAGAADRLETVHNHQSDGPEHVDGSPRSGDVQHRRAVGAVPRMKRAPVDWSMLLAGPRPLQSAFGDFCEIRIEVLPTGLRGAEAKGFDGVPVSRLIDRSIRFTASLRSIFALCFGLDEATQIHSLGKFFSACVRESGAEA